MILSAGTLGFVASVIIYVMYKDKGPFVRAHAANSLNIQIITGIVLLVSIPLMLVLIGFFTFGLALLFAFVAHSSVPSRQTTANGGIRRSRRGSCADRALIVR